MLRWKGRGNVDEGCVRETKRARVPHDDEESTKKGARLRGGGAGRSMSMGKWAGIEDPGEKVSGRGSSPNSTRFQVRVEKIGPVWGRRSGGGAELRSLERLAAALALLSRGEIAAKIRLWSYQSERER
jgi:hypothetical protein